MFGRLRKSKWTIAAAARHVDGSEGPVLLLTQYCSDDIAVICFSDFSFTWVFFLNQKALLELGIIEAQTLPLEIMELCLYYFSTHFPWT